MEKKIRTEVKKKIDEGAVFREVKARYSCIYISFTLELNSSECINLCNVWIELRKLLPYIHCNVCMPVVN